MSSGIAGPNSGGTRRDFGMPGKDRDLAESVEERIFREAKMERMCRYCEEIYIAAKDNQRFHTSRCATLYNHGRIDDATFTRWAKGLNEPFEWWNGQDEPDDPNALDIRVYRREQDITKFDFCRRRLYLTIAEMQKRAKAAAAADAVRTYKMLAEGLLKLWELPQSFDLFRFYYGKIVPGEFVTHDEPGFDEETDLPYRGLDALKLIADTFDRRWVSCGAKRLRDRDWLDL